MQPDPVGERPTAGQPADGIGKPGDLAQPVRHACDSLLVQLEAVQQGAGDTLAARLLHVPPVLVEYPGGLLLYAGGHGPQQFRSFASRHPGEIPSGRPGAPSNLIQHVAECNGGPIAGPPGGGPDPPVWRAGATPLPWRP